ncbi:hypothetical protein [Myceligenerans salitolerans]|uniref:Uncharacterized protein n=1 Tax=Myceligenerans salitolerans TaxID=1230528 RepID=A0ABS3IA90_9MICO|nr:hypothetical protein [Myceligenerans salitolerans]MBO0609878.1 hypothetical protein [Myceligenerans salitolerans]
MAAGSGLRVVIATQPKATDGGVDLAADLALTKAALLYADTVELVSPGAAMIAATRALESATTSNALDVLESFDHDTLQRLGGPLSDNWRQIVETVKAVDQAPALKRQLLDASPKLAELFEIVRGFDDSALRLRSVAADMVDASGLRELDEAIRLGVVTVNEVGAGQGDSDAMLAEYVDHIKRTLQDPAVHALFDESSASLARSLVREGHVEPNRLTLMHAKQAAVGGGLVAKLPSFPNSGMHDVLMLREDLGSPLGRYRRAVVALSEKLRSQAFDEESAVEVEDLWRNDVAPTLDDLRDGMERHTFVRHLAKQVGEEPMTVVAGVGSPGAILMGFQAITGVDSILSALAAAVPAAAGATSLAVKAATARGGELEKLRGNDLFYLHEINRRLGAT